MTARPRSVKAPPPTRVDGVREVMHGVELVDPYRWLEDQGSLEVRAWIDAQNTYTHALLDDLPSREGIRRRLSELMRIDQERPPEERDGTFFLWKKGASDDLWVLCQRQGPEGDDHVLIDSHVLSSDHTTTVTVLDISGDGRLLAYGMRQGGEDEIELHVMDAQTRRDLPDRLPRAIYRSLCFEKGNQGFYYARRERGVGERIYYHKMGADPAGDTLVFGEGYGPDKWISVQQSDDGRYLLFSVSHGWGRSELYVQDLAAGGPVRPIVCDVDAAFMARFAGDRLIVRTDWQAPNRRIVAIDPRDPAPERWQEIVPEGPDPIQDFSLAGSRLFVHYLHNVRSQVRVFTPTGEPLGEVPLPGLGTASSPAGRWESDTAFFTFQSYTVPPTIYRYDVATGECDIWARDQVPFDPDGFETHQVWYSSRDGTRVPMSIVHRKGLVRDGNRPTLLHGYGGFNGCLTPQFSPLVTVWIESGGVYAVANLRGGGEFGESWHRAGMLDKKQNVFDDFIAAAEWLTANGYTQPSRLAIQGASNGGLLVGAALTQRPDLFQAVLCQFPDLDMVRYYQFKNNNAPALLEYGNAADPEQFKFLYAYSPYQNVRPGTAYPAILLVTGDADTRVPPEQARKMTALLQASTASGRPVLCLYDTKAGHSGGRPLSKVIEDLSLEIAFLFWQLGVRQDAT